MLFPREGSQLARLALLLVQPLAPTAATDGEPMLAIDNLGASFGGSGDSFQRRAAARNWSEHGIRPPAEFVMGIEMRIAKCRHGEHPAVTHVTGFADFTVRNHSACASSIP